MSKQRRVVITGLGLINALGQNQKECFEAMAAGKIGIRRIETFEPGGFDSQIAGEAPKLSMAKAVPRAHRKATKLMSRDIELAVVAADDAIRDAKLVTKGTDPDQQPSIEPTRSGVNIGAGLICCDLIELAAATEYAVENDNFSLKKWGSEGMAMLTPLWLLKYLPNMLSCHISIIHDLQGPSNSVTCAEASGQLAIGEAFRTIVRNQADLMVAGGAETKVTGMGLIRQCLLNRASKNYNDRPQQACRPFDRDADGTVVAEGAGVVVLEELEHAKKRDAHIYAEIVGFGASNNFTENFVEPEPTGMGTTIAIKKAIKEADINGEDINLIVPCGLGRPADDLAEAKGIEAAIGSAVEKIPALATKSRVGNCGAGAAAIDMVAMIATMANEKIPANMNCPNPLDGCKLKLENKNIENVKINHALTCCNTFGGQTAAIAVRKI